MSCVIWGCKSHSSRKENNQGLLSFHRFPADDDKKKEWLNRIGRRNWTPKRHSHICSKHFTEDSFTCATGNKWRRLREDAMPTLNITDQADEWDCIPMDFEIVPSTSFQINETEQSCQTISSRNQVPEQVLMDISNKRSSSSDTVVHKANQNYKRPISDSEGYKVSTSKRPKHMTESNTDSDISEQISHLHKANQNYKRPISDSEEYNVSTSKRPKPMTESNTDSDISEQISHLHKANQNYKRPISDSEEYYVSTSKRPKPMTESNTDFDISEQISHLQEIVADYKKQIETLQKEIERVKKISKRRLRKINTLTKRTSRSNAKNSQLYEILIEKLKEENVQSEHLALLESINKNDIIKRYLQKQEGETLSREYTLDFKKFAVTLHYLSPRAYTYIRDRFEKVLPHPKTISAWYKGINCNPGFTAESLDAIRARVQENPAKKLFCALAIDEMSIRKFVEWDSYNMNYYGYVSLGFTMDSDSVAVASQALTFMVTSINDTWKIPVGYFLIASITAEQKSVLVEQCLHLLYECGVVVASLTFDGAANNISMASHLGCDMASGAVSFQCAGSEVCLWPDPCHNLKLVRNTFADKKILKDGEENIISWEYIERLLQIQENEGLHLGTKLKKEHVNFIKQKMKVRLAAQLFSNSVADALQYCKDKNIPGFEKCSATIKFLRIFNDLFDIFNSRNMRAKGYKKALTTFNYEQTEVFFTVAENYIKTLKTSDGTCLINSNRKTGFNGFLVCMKSLTKMYHNIILNDSLQYLCTYKMSQDHIELFFGAIRAKCGFNNNPSARMFQAAYKKLLVHAQFKDGSSGNCVPLESITVLNCTSGKSLDAINKSSGNLRIVCDETEELSPEMLLSQIDLDHDYVLSPQSLSEYSIDVVEYIAGFVVRKLRKMLKCETCLESLNDQKYSGRVSLISVKDRGGLMKPSKDVFIICKITEKILREQKSKLGVKCLGTPKQMTFITNKVFGSFKFSNVFDTLAEHSLEQDFDVNHGNLMMKLICKLFLTVRIHHLTKQICEPADKIRHHLTKTIIFKGQ